MTLRSSAQTLTKYLVVVIIAGTVVTGFTTLYSGKGPTIWATTNTATVS